jgi:hypothetical protein
MPRGGKRPGSGNRFKWHHGKTVTIRVPIALVDRILEIAQGLDRGLSFIEKGEEPKTATIDCGTQSKVIDMSGVSITVISGQMGVKLSDLVRKGYKIEPKSLNDVVLTALTKEW